MLTKKIRDRLSVDIEDKDLVELIEQHNYFNFKHKTRKEQFLFAMALGVDSGLNEINIKNRKEWFHVKDLQPQDEAMIKACALYKTGSMDILNDLDEIYSIAEQFAHIGFKVLLEMVNSTSLGSIEKKFEVTLKDRCKKLQIE